MSRPRNLERLPGYKRGQRLGRTSNPNYTYDKRADTLRYWFNLTVEQYDAMLEQQDYRCAICHRHQDEFKRKFAVDHRHECCPSAPLQCGGTCIRGLLCGSCNIGLGNMGESTERLESAILYLNVTKHPLDAL